MNRLTRLIPPEWWINIRAFGPIILSGAVFLGVVLTYVILARPQNHSHAGYVPVETVSTFDTSTDSGFSYRAVVRLPDGTQTTVSTSSLAAAQWFVSDTCVEKRVHDSGRAFYTLAAPSNCLP